MEKMTELKISNSKIQSLEGLRGIASLNVVLSHAMFIFFPYVMRNLYPGLQKQYIQKFQFEDIISLPIFNALYNGHFAVCIFFVLSGCVLISGFHQTGDQNIIQGRALRRYIRLAIPVMCAVIFSVILLKFGLFRNQEVFNITQSEWFNFAFSGAAPSFRHAIFSGTVGAFFFGDSTYDGPLWTMRPELIGSFLLFAAYSIFGNRRLLAVVTSFSLVALLSFPTTFALLYLAFLAGSLLTTDIVTKNTNQIAGFAAILAGIYFGSFDYSSHNYLLNSINLPSSDLLHINFNDDKKTFFNVIGATLLVYGVIATKQASRILSSRPFSFLGKLSFPLYLLHMPILCSLTSSLFIFFMGNFGYTTSAALSMLISLPVIIMASYLFSRFVDTPATKFSSYLLRYPNERSGVGIRNAKSEFNN